MELGLSLGEASNGFSLVEKSSRSSRGFEFCKGFGVEMNTNATEVRDRDEHESNSGRRSAGEEEDDEDYQEAQRGGRDMLELPAAPPIQLDLLPLAPVPLRFSWPADHGGSSTSSPAATALAGGLDVNLFPYTADGEDAAAANSPSSLQMDLSIYSGRKRDGEAERASSRASDDEENSLTRKKLRLSKEQSAFLEESFKEHNTLNPKQKVALAKQLNLRTRQVEVWFQNRRARTKLKQTEVDCEYLKGCCETLTEENRRLQKELQELRALKTCSPFYMQLPATTLTMCPSCERVATTTTAPASAADTSPKSHGFPVLSKPKFLPFSRPQQPHQPTAS